MTTAHKDLPALPVCAASYNNGRFYSADQMRDYARAALARPEPTADRQSLPHVLPGLALRNLRSWHYRKMILNGAQHRNHSHRCEQYANAGGDQNIANALAKRESKKAEFYLKELTFHTLAVQALNGVVSGSAQEDLKNDAHTQSPIDQ